MRERERERERERKRERERERVLTYGIGQRRPQELREHKFLIRQLDNDGYGSSERESSKN